MLKSFCGLIADLIFPPRCPVCRSYVDAQGMFCKNCYIKILHVRKVPIDRRYLQLLSSVYALTNYHDGMKTVIQRLKYQKKLGVLTHIHSILAQAVPQEILRGNDYFVPVPLHPAKQKERGFNQTQEIYGEWIRDNGACLLDALIRVRETQPQYALTVDERRRNMKAAFAVKGGMSLCGRNIVLLDDIFTTGMTMEACAKALRKAGAGRITGLVLASDA